MAAMAGRFTALIGALLLAACAPGPPGAGVELKEGSYRPPLGSSGLGVAYGVLKSDRDEVVVALSSSAAERVELHATREENGFSRMVRLERLDLPAGEAVRLEPQGLHLMVIRPADLAPGAPLPVTLTLQSGVTLTVEFAQSADPVPQRN